MANEELEPHDTQPQPALSERRASMPLSGKAALITGAARRVGASIARKLHEAGANIVLHYRSSADDAADLARDLNYIRTGSVTTISGDLLDTDKLPALAHTAGEAFGGLHLLGNKPPPF